MDELGYGKDYQYAHSQEDKLTSMKTMPPDLADHQYYFPSDQGNEQRFKQRLEYIKNWHTNHDQ